MIDDKFVEVKIGARNINNYENLGYEIPKRLDSRNRLVVERGTKISVSVLDLPKGCATKVNISCDGCGRKSLVLWENYNKYLKNDKYLCQSCAFISSGNEKRNKNKLENGGRSFRSWCIDNNEQSTLDRWDYNLNNISPDDVLFSTYRKYYFKCERDIHESELKELRWLTSCGNRIDCILCNSLAQNLLDNYGEDFINSIWSERNAISFWEFSYRSPSEIYWKCQNGIHEDYKRTVDKSHRSCFRCPECSNERLESYLQEKVRLFLKDELMLEINHEHNCVLRCYNEKTKNTLPYDNEIIFENGERLIIEVMGAQHYEITHFTKMAARKKKTTENYELEYQQWKDEYKKQCALENGYHYLAIPYWEDDKKGTWKKSINKIIYQILEVSIE